METSLALLQATLTAPEPPIPPRWAAWCLAALEPGAGIAQLEELVRIEGRRVRLGGGPLRACLQLPCGRWALPATATGRWFHYALELALDTSTPDRSAL